MTVLFRIIAAIAALGVWVVAPAASPGQGSSQSGTDQGGVATSPAWPSPNTGSGQSGSGRQWPSGSGQWDPRTPPSGTGAGSGTGSSQSAAAATDEQSAGLVLVSTQIDFGTASAAGTGMVIDSDGIVVTNHHVVAGSTEVTVTVPATDKTYSAEVLGYDATTDVAILQLDGASGLTTVTTDLAAVSVGATVTSVGNAQGGGELIAAPGTVTALGQNITVNEDNGTTADLTDLIQVNAAMVPGDSGGAMLDAEGEVIGMNVAGSTNTSDQVGYAIPITSVMTIADSVLKGVSTQSITLGRTGFLGVQMTTGTDVTVAGLISGSPAVAAGLTVGSVITAVDNTPIAARADLTAILASHQPGDQVAVAWTDMGGATHTETITLAEAPLA